MGLNYKYLFIGVLVLVVFSSTFLIILDSDATLGVIGAVSFGAEDDSGDEGIGNNQESTSSGVSSGGGRSGGGSGGGSSSSGESLSGCREIQISYSIQSFFEGEECLDSLGGICTRKEVECSAEIFNLDEVSGDFVVRMGIVKEGLGFNEAIETVILEQYVTAGNIEGISNVFSVVSGGSEGNANKDLACLFRTESVPRKEVC